MSFVLDSTCYTPRHSARPAARHAKRKSQLMSALCLVCFTPAVIFAFELGRMVTR